MSIEHQFLIAFLTAVIAVVALCVAGQVILSLAQRLRRTEERLDRIEMCALLAEAMAKTPAPAQTAPPQLDSTDEDDGPTLVLAPEGLPRIVMAQVAFETLARHFRQEHNDRPGVETGVALVGRMDGDGPDRRIIVNGLIDAGDDDRSVGHVRFNRDYQQRQLDKLHFLDPRASHIGDAHTHPGSLDRCSIGDYHTDLANVRSSNTQEMVFVIATEASSHRYRSNSALSIYAEGFKLDFFYLGKASGYRYCRVKPQISPAESMLTFPEPLAALAQRDPERFRMEWASLRSLTGWTLNVGSLELEGLRRPCLDLTSTRGAGTVLIILDDDAMVPPRVYVQSRGDGDMISFEPEFLARRWSEHIWLAQVALSATRELERRAQTEPASPTDAFSARLIVPV